MLVDADVSEQLPGYIENVQKILSAREELVGGSW
jgi:hypothetical protein